jgi:hypothetical protein
MLDVREKKSEDAKGQSLQTCRSLDGKWQPVLKRNAAVIRIEFEGALYHIICRGDRREEIFRDDRLVEREEPSYGRVLGDYIHLNPARAGLINEENPRLGLSMEQLSGVLRERKAPAMASGR